ncbi:MAG TPA: type II toxin-antitoxin system VapC family toxin [Ktedonobacteraceae bacterium]|nr:type II toxin-antitoxin system VapC family toxin [Ktedonobacteraceae bacterium]
MSVSVVVDASVWVSLLRDEDINHIPSRLWLEQYIAINGAMTSPTFLLIEVAAAISRQTGQAELAKKALEELKGNTVQFVAIDDNLIQSAIDVATNMQLRAGDTIYVALARQLNLPLISWDKEQLLKASKVITTYTPSTYPFSKSEDLKESE